MFQGKNIEWKYPDVEAIANEGEEFKEKKQFVEEQAKSKKKYKQTFGLSGGRKQGVPSFFEL